MAKRRKKAAKKTTRKASKRASPMAHLARKVADQGDRIGAIEKKIFSGKRRNKHGGHSTVSAKHHDLPEFMD